MIDLDQSKVDAALSQLACAQGDHRWKRIGGCACCCDLGDNIHGECSLPVHECEECGDCDYGDNADSAKIKAECKKEST